MSEVFTIKVDANDENYLNGIEIESLFPEYYSPLLVESNHGPVVNIVFNEGAGRFFFRGLDIECQFEYYAEAQNYIHELGENYAEEADNRGENFVDGLVEYVAEKITDITGLETSYFKNSSD